MELTGDEKLDDAIRKAANGGDGNAPRERPKVTEEEVRRSKARVKVMSETVLHLFQTTGLTLEDALLTCSIISASIVAHCVKEKNLGSKEAEVADLKSAAAILHESIVGFGESALDTIDGIGGLGG